MALPILRDIFVRFSERTLGFAYCKSVCHTRALKSVVRLCSWRRSLVPRPLVQITVIGVVLVAVTDGEVPARLAA